LGGRHVHLVAALDRWSGADHRYFKRRGGDSAIDLLRHDTARDLSELTPYAAPAATVPAT
jgi:hypothetical protein